MKLIFRVIIIHIYSCFHLWNAGAQHLPSCTLSGLPADSIFEACLLYVPDQGYTFTDIRDPAFWLVNGKMPSGEKFDRRATYWLRGSLIRNTPGNPGLIQLQNWSHIELYLPDRVGVYHRHISGLATAQRLKIYSNYHNYFDPPFFDQDTLVFFARVRSNFPVFTLPLQQKFIIRQEDPSTLLAKQEKNQWFLPFQGFLLTQIIFALLLFWWNREKILLYYLLTNSGLLLYDIAGGPMRSFVHIFPQWYYLEYLLAALTPIIVAYAVLHFERTYLALDKHLPRFQKLLHGLFMGLIFFRAIGLVVDYGFDLFTANGIDERYLIIVSNLSILILALMYIFLFLGIFFLPVWAIYKKIPGAWLLFVSVMIPSSSTVLASYVQGRLVLMHFLQPHFPYTIGLHEHGLGAPVLDPLYASVYLSMQLGELIFITLVAAMIGIRARKIYLEKQQALEAKATAEQQVSAELRKVDSLKDQFLANTSHELRTPLQGIIGLSEALQEKIKDPAQQEDLGLIVASGKRLSNLVNDLLDFSKLKHQDISLVLTPVNLHALVELIIKHNQPLIKGKSLILENSVPPGLPALKADENRLQQILYNLIGNGIKFTEVGSVKVGAILLPDTDQVTIYVQDTGSGIPAEKKPWIFKEFVQVDDSLTRRHGGTGLGLSITKRLVELHGGTLWFESTFKQGSTFYFTMPLYTDMPVQSENQLAPLQVLTETNLVNNQGEINPTSPVQSETHGCVLIVDDEAVVRRVLKNQLEQHHYQVIQAAHGAEALELIFAGDKIDLVLLDIMMPVMSGYEVCRKIREKFLPSELPIIMITAKDQVQDIIEGLSLGANDYLTKPFSKDELLARIRTQLDLRMVFEATGRFVPNEFLHALGRERITEVTLGDFIQREVTVMFADIRDYTGLAESMTPEDNYRFVNAFHGRIGPVIIKNHGFVNQYLGDGVMALFPALPADALQAAVAMQIAVQNYNQDRLIQGRRTLEIGIGLHIGPLIMGIIGDSRRMDAATIADAVNTASRLESLTKYYGAKIVLSDDTHDKILSSGHTEFCFRYLGQVVVKGKIEPIGVYECIDGDIALQKELKIKTLDQFKLGVNLYFQRSFSRASVVFESILEKNPDDKIVKLFLNKSAANLASGVPGDWNGVEKMLFK